MPRRDGTGPTGAGTLSGRGTGECRRGGPRGGGSGLRRRFGGGGGRAGRGGIVQQLLDLGAELLQERKEKDGNRAE